MKEPVTLEKEYTTRSGRPVHLLSLEASGPFPVIGLIEAGRHRTVGRWTLNGEYKKGSSGRWDLIPVRHHVSRTFWVNITRDGYESEIHATQSAALSAWTVASRLSPEGGSSRIACVRVTIECTEGDGLTDAASVRARPA